MDEGVYLEEEADSRGAASVGCVPVIVLNGWVVEVDG